MTPTTVETITEAVVKAVPKEWFSAAASVAVDDDELLIVGQLAGVADDADEAADAARVSTFREETRDARIEIARVLEHTFGRKVSWGATSRNTRGMFSTVSTPVMTRLRFDERGVLDTLIAAGVARSRSDALAWCVKLVAKNEEAWLGDLREALVKVREVRREGPRSTSS